MAPGGLRVSVPRWLWVSVAAGFALWVWHHGPAVHGVSLSPTPSCAEKVETDEAVIYRADPHEAPGALDQRFLEERKEAASWEMLRQLTIEVEWPRSVPASALPFRPKKEKFPGRPSK